MVQIAKHVLLAIGVSDKLYVYKQNGTDSIVTFNSELSVYHALGVKLLTEYILESICIYM